jgi:hypothetical protein
MGLQIGGGGNNLAESITTAGSVGGGILDSLPLTAFAASTRKLRTAYTGPALRVRRSSDNAEIDVGFLGNGELDTFSLMNHVGAENLLTFSEQFDNAAWGIVAAGNFSPVPNSGAAPDGTQTATKMLSVTGGSALSRVVNATATAHTFIIYTKAGNRVSAGNFLLRNNTTAVALASVAINWATQTEDAYHKYVGNGWWKITVPIAGGITIGDQLGLYLGATGSVPAGEYYYLWGASLVTGSADREYCRTLGAATVNGSGFISKFYDQSGQQNLITNGGFDAGTASWAVTAGAAFSVVAGSAVVVSTGVSNELINQIIPTVAGKSYIISADVLSAPQQFGVVVDGATSIPFSSTTGSRSGYFTAIGPTTTLYLKGGGANSNVTLDNFSVKEVRDLVQATAANQPRLVNAGVIDRMSSGNLKPMIRTDGVAQTLVTGSFAVPQPFTRASALQVVALPGAGARDIFANRDNTMPFLALHSNTNMYLWSGSSVVGKAGVINGEAATVVETYSGAASSISYNRSVTAGNPGANGADGLSVGIGADGPANIMYGDILIFPSALSQSNRQSLEANQKGYYGTP